ncbi:serine hydrolase [Sphingomonas citricola]|uniref:serine hydrolase n=1 Tax=Sphingomonas citricola TaxID=2862498 RepID=UPI00215625E7|nr:serine hydrolase [Sphingomonas citricola]
MRIPFLRTFMCVTVSLLPAQAMASSSDLRALENELRNLVSGRSGEYGVAALDLRDGASVAVNGDMPFAMASTVKLAIAAAFLADVDAGRRSLDDVVGGRRASDAMELMIVRSDNHAADQLLAAVGGPAVIQGWLNAHGFAGIRVDRTIAQLLRERGHLADVKDVATPTAMVALLSRLEDATVLTARSSGYLFGLMRRCMTGTRRIRALLPPGTTVEDKTGTLDGVTNDVGFITMPDGHRVAIAIFARGGRDRQPGIAAIARLVYDRFADSTRNALAVFMQLR